MTTLCSFCGRSSREVKKIIGSPTGSAYICEYCIEACADVLLAHARNANSLLGKLGLASCKQLYSAGFVDGTGIYVCRKRRYSCADDSLLGLQLQ